MVIGSRKRTKKLLALGKKLEKLFCGYAVTSVDPDIVLTRWEQHQSGKSTPVDTVYISEMAAKCLLTGKEPKRKLRWDL